MTHDPDFADVVYDEAQERVFFSVLTKSGVERRYRLTIEHGRPVVEEAVDRPDSPS